MFLKLPTRWIAVLFVFFAALTWNACSKDHSFEKNNGSIIDDIIPDGDTSNNDNDSTGNDDDNDDDTANSGNDDSTTTSDVEFLKKASIINHAQVTNAILATERGEAQSVRDFGGALKLRFGQAQDDVGKVADQLDVSVPTETDAAHQSVTRGLLDMEGRTFDIAFTDYQMGELQAAVDLYRAQIENGKDSRVKAYAQKYLPYLEELLLTASNIRQTL